MYYIYIMIKKKIQGVYCIRNLINNKRYIGSSKDYQLRIQVHLRLLRRGNHHSPYLQNSFSLNKEDNFEFSLLEVVEDSNLLLQIEERWVLFHKTLDKNFGYNTILPTQGGCNIKRSNGILRKFSSKAPGNLKNMSPEEWLEKRRKDPNFTVKTSRPGYGKGIPTRKIIGVDVAGNIIHTFPSVTSGAKFFKKNIKTLEVVLKINKKYENLRKNINIYWFYEELFDRNRFLEIINLPKPEKKKYIRKENPISHSERNIQKCPITLQHIITLEKLDFPSISDAARFLKLSANRVTILRRGYRNKGKGRIVKITSIHNYRIIKNNLES